MSLRFQTNDEVDRNIKHGPFTHWLVMVLIAGALGLLETIRAVTSSESLAVYGRNILDIVVITLAGVGVITLIEQIIGHGIGICRLGLADFTVQRRHLLGIGIDLTADIRSLLPDLVIQALQLGVDPVEVIG